MDNYNRKVISIIVFLRKFVTYIKHIFTDSDFNLD